LESFSDHIPAAGNLNVSTHRKENKMKVYDVVPGLEFDPERDFEQSPAWFLDGTHSVPPWTPMFGWFWINFCRHGMQYGAEKLSLPTVKGWDWRFMNGGGYLTLLLVKSEEEKQRREERFRKAILPFIQDYDGLWNGFVDEILGRYESLKSLNLDEATNIELLDNFEETINTCRRMWEIHMYMMYGTYTAYILFENMCRELAGIDDTGLSGRSSPVGMFETGPGGWVGGCISSKRARQYRGCPGVNGEGQSISEGLYGFYE
jgi:hypothetical protein